MNDKKQYNRNDIVNTWTSQCENVCMSVCVCDRERKKCPQRMYKGSV